VAVARTPGIAAVPTCPSPSASYKDPQLRSRNPAAPLLFPFRRHRTSRGGGEEEEEEEEEQRKEEDDAESHEEEEAATVGELR
jgi:hypothetical protein